MLVACGEIREVAVAATDTDLEAETGESSGSSSGGPMGVDSGATDGSSGPDMDTEGFEETGSSGSPPTPPEPVSFCRGAEEALVERGQVFIELEVSGVDEAATVTLGVRGTNRSEEPLHLDLVHGSASATLIDAPCGGNYSLLFADGGALDPDVACLAPTPPEGDKSVASMQPLSALLDGGANGMWRLTMPLSGDEAAVQRLESVCVVFHAVAR